MSTFEVTVERLTIESHPNADALEMAVVGGYKAIVRKGDLKTGDLAVYIPEQAILPNNIIEEMGLEGRLAGSNKNRVKAVRLRGELSQGLVYKPDWEESVYETLFNKKVNIAKSLNILKWRPEIPIHMSGQLVPAPSLIRWSDVENIKRYPDLFSHEEMVSVTEKIHGTCFLLTLDTEREEVYVSSKGNGGKSLALVESDTNLYWRAAKKYNLAQVAENIARDNLVRKVGIFGEVFGKGVQDLHYGLNDIDFRAFDVALEGSSGLSWAQHDYLKMHLPTVPLLYFGFYDYDGIASLAEGMETISGTEAHIREGVVVRNVLGERKIAKFINPDYLTRKDGTEYE